MVTKKRNSIQKNYAYNLAYEAFLLIMPFVVTPYVSRALGEDASGQYSFIYSIVTYFTYFAALGFDRYAQRLIAQHQGNRKDQTKIFWEVFIARLIPVFISVVIYIGIIFSGVLDSKYNELLVIFSINVISVAFDITFLFRGNEDFGKIVFRNIIVRIVGIICIFVFVHSAQDLWIYALIQSLTVIIGNLSLWFYLGVYVERRCSDRLIIKNHIKRSFILFLPTIATAVYTSLDKTLIGVITQIDSENGNYEYAESFVKMSMVVITSLGTAVAPRNSHKYATGDLEGMRKNVNNSLRVVFLFGIPIMLGLIAISDGLIPWYLGPGYLKSSTLMKLLSPLVLIIGLSNVFGLQILLPCERDKKFTVSVSLGAILNFGLNCILISFFASYGAAISTIIAEGVVTLTMMFFAKDIYTISGTIKSIWKYMMAGAIMFFPCYFVDVLLPDRVYSTIIVVILGIVVYFGIILILRDDFIFMLIYSFKRKLRENK